MKYSKLVHFLVINFISAILLISCNDRDRFEFPYVYMNVSINVDTDPEYAQIRIPSEAVQVINHPNGGTSLGYDNNGLIIYHGIDRFYAYDRTCPNELPESVAIELDGSTARCPVCNSVYVLPSEGQPAYGSVSKYILHQYKTYYSSGVLQIYN